MSSEVSTSQETQLPMGTALMESSPSMPPSFSLRNREKPLTDGNETELLSVSWNQDYTCFTAGTSSGFRVYNCEPFSEAFRRISDKGFGLVEMLFKSSIFAIGGGGANPQYPPNKVMIWDDHLCRCEIELKLSSDVLGVKLKHDRFVVVLNHKINIYSFKPLRLIHEIETSDNPRGLCCLSYHSNNSVLVCPGLRRGQVRVEHFGLKTIMFINAHDSHIASMTLTLDGLLLATASTKGTLIRIFNTTDGTCLQEVRRGLDRADIYSIAFSSNLQWLAVSSDKGTIHVFSLRVRGVEDGASRQHVSGEGGLGMTHQNSSASHTAFISSNTGVKRSSSMSFIKGVLPKYFSSERSFAQFYLPETTRYMAAFGTQNTVAIVGMDGSFYRCTFDPLNGGEMVQNEYIRFLKD